MLTGFHFEPDMQLFIVQMQDVPVILILIAAAVAAEVFLARKEDWRLGLALPGGLLVSNVIRCVVRAVRYSPWLDELFLALAVENIPMLILLAVYVLCRFVRRRRLVRQMDKIRIDDL